MNVQMVLRFDTREKAQHFMDLCAHYEIEDVAWLGDDSVPHPRIVVIDRAQEYVIPELPSGTIVEVST